MSDKRCKVAVLASGTGTNFRAIADACARDGFPAEVVCLVTDNPEAGALSIAREFGIESAVVEVAGKKGSLPEEAETEITAICRKAGADLICLAGFMRILKHSLLDEFEGRIMNIHPSLLPSFRGLHGVRQALEYGVKITGCTVHFVDRSLDGGPIIIQAGVMIDDDDDEDKVLEKVHKEEHRIYVRAIELFARGKLRAEGRRVRTS